MTRIVDACRDAGAQTSPPQRISIGRSLETLVECANSKDKSLKLYPKLAHDLLHEPEKEMVMTDIEKWIDTC